MVKVGQFVLVKAFYHRASGETGCRSWQMVDHIPAKVAEVTGDVAVLDFLGWLPEPCNCPVNGQKHHAYPIRELVTGG